MKANLRAVGAVILGSVVLGACATKGFVRTSVRDERAARIAADSSLSNTIDHGSRRRSFGDHDREERCRQPS